jgi:hypothetical protein
MMKFSDIVTLFNRVEPFIWYVIAIGLLIVLKGRVEFRQRLLLAVALVVFGTSDFFEAAEGRGWWSPWWLPMWKLVSGAAALWLIWRIARASRCVERPAVHA